MDERYRIVFSGELRGHDQSSKVVERLARKFKMPSKQARVLVFGGARRVIKKDLDEEDAKHYLAALEKIGLVVKVEPMTPSTKKLTLAPSMGEPDRITDPPLAEWTPLDAGGLALIRCPACGSMGVKDGICQDCGVVREKYIARLNR